MHSVLNFKTYALHKTPVGRLPPNPNYPLFFWGGGQGVKNNNNILEVIITYCRPQQSSNVNFESR